MPMDFPDHESVVRRVCEPENAERAARMRQLGIAFFRRPEPGESEESFRIGAANFVRNVRGDSVEAAEIRTGRGWDRQSPLETLRELPGALDLVAELIDQQHPRRE
jgi:hypothetical protein